MIDLLIVGGGAAGLWAAGTAAKRGLRIAVLEKNNKLGVKILMSGGTRCNITQDTDAKGILSAFGLQQGRFLKHVVHALPPSAVVAEIENLGVRTKVEETGKVFPVSNRALDVRNALVTRAESAGAKLHSGIAARVIEREGSLWRVVDEHGHTWQAQNLLICSGGLSYAGCGTTGDGYSWASALGHSLAPTAPALTPLVTQESWGHELSGLTLPDVAARIQYSTNTHSAELRGEKSKSEPRMSSRGGLLWTHFGFSGPVPMNLSRYVTDPGLQTQSNDNWKPEIVLDLVPDIPEPKLEELFRVQAGKSDSNKRQLGTVLASLVAKRLGKVMLARAGIDAQLSLGELPKLARKSLIRDLKTLCLPITDTQGYPKAEVTQGGVNLKEVNPKTCESRLIPSLYFAGEILNVDGPIGGYNFQAAFSTGHAVGLAVSASETATSDSK